MFWVRLIQEIDYKESAPTSKGWEYRMLDTITTLDPRYKIVYRAGATVLSVVVQDVQGATALYEKGVKQFPDDWSLLYRAGYHSLFEEKNCVRAAELLNQAVAHGAPSWLSSLVSRLYEGSGQYEIARGVLVDALKRFEGTDVEKRLQERLTELENQNRLSTNKIQCK